jgi:hypothetical protein
MYRYTLALGLCFSYIVRPALIIVPFWCVTMGTGTIGSSPSASIVPAEVSTMQVDINYYKDSSLYQTISTPCNQAKLAYSQFLRHWHSLKRGKFGAKHDITSSSLEQYEGNKPWSGECHKLSKNKEARWLANKVFLQSQPMFTCVYKLRGSYCFSAFDLRLKFICCQLFCRCQFHRVFLYCVQKHDVPYSI